MCYNTVHNTYKINTNDPAPIKTLLFREGKKYFWKVLAIEKRKQVPKHPEF
jgi:hypothetical protein